MTISFVLPVSVLSVEAKQVIRVNPKLHLTRCFTSQEGKKSALTSHDFYCHSTFFDKIKKKPPPLYCQVLEYSYFSSCFRAVKLKFSWASAKHLALLAEAKHALPDQVAQQILGICDKELEKSPEEKHETCLCLKLLAISLWQCSLFPN